jgi:pimeloyl-ACP methyl ester carboxylesterase
LKDTPGSACQDAQAGYSILHILSLKSLANLSWVSKEFRNASHCPGASVHCIVDDFLWPWVDSTPVLMMHGFARNATFWNRWVPAIAETHRVYRPDLLGCGLSDQRPNGYRYTPET